MKKIITRIALLSSLGGAMAQPTITYTDFSPLNGSRAEMRYAQSFNVGNLGANQIWDFSAVSTIDTVWAYYDTPVSNPLFPNANTAVNLYYGSSFISYGYNTLSANGIYNVGSVIEPPSLTKTSIYEPAYRLLPLPLSYNDYDSSTISYYVVNKDSNGVNTTRYHITETVTTSADAWGTITTPFGTHSNVLRVRCTSVSFQDSLWNWNGTVWVSGSPVMPQISSTTYYWLANGIGYVAGATGFQSGSNNGSGGYFYKQRTPIGTTSPVAPTDLQASSGKTESATVNLTWTDNANNETGFKVERSTNDSSFSQIADIPTANTQNYEDATVEVGTTYYYRVLAYNSESSSAYSNVVQVTAGTVGINDIEENAINVYPNPANDYVTITGMKIGTEIRITNLLSEVLYSAKTQSETENVSIANLASGMYFLNNKKFIKQ